MPLALHPASTMVANTFIMPCCILVTRSMRFSIVSVANFQAASRKCVTVSSSLAWLDAGGVVFLAVPDWPTG